jgi:hypothetical protein
MSAGYGYKGCDEAGRCLECLKPMPQEYCWNGSTTCLVGRPPRHIDPCDLWLRLAELERRIAAVEATILPKE